MTLEILFDIARHFISHYMFLSDSLEDIITRVLMRIIQLSLRSVHRVRVRTNKRQKINGLPSPRAEAGQENIETVHEPKPIQTAGSL